MTTMIERVATAIGEVGSHQSMPMNHDEAVALARAALAALREPTSNVIAAGLNVQPVEPIESILARWQAMIDVALEETGK